MTLNRFLGWTAVVAILWLVLAGAFADDETCTWICFSFGDMLALLLIPAGVLWGLGLVVLYVAGRLRGHRSSNDAERDPGPR